MKYKDIAAIITSDIHLRESAPKSRIDNYWETQKRKINFIRSVWEDCDKPPILDSGDMFNSWKTSPMVEAWIISNLPRPFYTVVGNHEMPNHNINYLNKSSLNVLLQAGVVKLALTDIPEYKGVNFELFGVNYREDFLTSVFNFISDKPKVLILHTMVTKEIDARFKSHTAEELLGLFPEFDLIITGHNHDSFVVEDNGRFLVNPGSLMRSSSSQIDYEPRIFLWNYDGEIIPISVPIEPAEEVFDIEEINQRKNNDKRIQRFVDGFNNDYDIGISFEKNLEMFYSKNKTREGIKEIIVEALNE